MELSESAGTRAITLGKDPEQVFDPRAGREAMKAKCVACAIAHTPPEVRYFKIRKTLSGKAFFREKAIAAPKPFTRRALHVFLHECAHFVLHGLPGVTRKPRHVEEYEAEQWANARMRDAGIAIPRKSLNRGKAYVRYKINQAVSRNAKTLDGAALRWADPSGVLINELQRSGINITRAKVQERKESRRKVLTPAARAQMKLDNAMKRAADLAKRIKGLSTRRMKWERRIRTYERMIAKHGANGVGGGAAPLQEVTV